MQQLAAAAEPQDGGGHEHFIWPDNVQAWQCWQAVRTQWRVGMAGPTGLDYAGVLAYLRELGLLRSERREVFDAIQACEAEQLLCWDEQRQREDKQQGGAMPR
jgi:hypothetical protein